MRKLICSFLFLFCLTLTSIGQNVDEVEKSGAFEYNGEDKLRSSLNFHDKHYGGFSVKSIIANEDFEGAAFFIFYEYGYLLMPKNESFNVSLSAAPQLAIFPLGAIDLPFSCDLNFGSEAGTGVNNVGASLGAGYDAFFFIGGFTEFSPFVRFRLTVENFYGGFQFNTNRDNFLRYSVSAGVKFDW